MIRATHAISLALVGSGLIAYQIADDSKNPPNLSSMQSSSDTSDTPDTQYASSTQSASGSQNPPLAPHSWWYGPHYSSGYGGGYSHLGGFEGSEGFGHSSVSSISRGGFGSSGGHGGGE